jgi:hypothetical protein
MRSLTLLTGHCLTRAAFTFVQLYSFEKECQALQRDSKQFQDAMRCESSARCMSVCYVRILTTGPTAMTTTQARLAETIETFYGAADRTSDGAMASHAFKSAVEELDSGIQRELVRDL